MNAHVDPSSLRDAALQAPGTAAAARDAAQGTAALGPGAQEVHEALFAMEVPLREATDLVTALGFMIDDLEHSAIKGPMVTHELLITERLDEVVAQHAAAVTAFREARLSASGKATRATVPEALAPIANACPASAIGRRLAACALRGIEINDANDKGLMAELHAIHDVEDHLFDELQYVVPTSPAGAIVTMTALSYAMQDASVRRPFRGRDETRAAAISRGARLKSVLTAYLVAASGTDAQALGLGYYTFSADHQGDARRRYL